MFGQKNDSNDADATPDVGDTSVLTADANEPSPPEVVEPTAAAAAAATNDNSWQHPGAPLATDGSSEPEVPPPDSIEPIRDVISPAGGFPSSPNTRITNSGHGASSSDNDDSGSDSTDLLPANDVVNADLVDIKQKALGELSPLIDKLDLPPEDKFRTVMMMIQASDDDSLVKLAYDAAHAINDEKAKAQALLDIVNEINYFTQPKQ